MPARTKSGLRPVIVYLPEKEYAEVEKQAEELDRPMSYVGRELIAEALAWRACGREPNSGHT